MKQEISEALSKSYSLCNMEAAFKELLRRKERDLIKETARFLKAHMKLPTRQPQRLDYQHSSGGVTDEFHLGDDREGKVMITPKEWPLVEKRMRRG